MALPITIEDEAFAFLSVGLCYVRQYETLADITLTTEIVLLNTIREERYAFLSTKLYYHRTV